MNLLVGVIDGHGAAWLNPERVRLSALVGAEALVETLAERHDHLDVLHLLSRPYRSRPGRRRRGVRVAGTSTLLLRVLSGRDRCRRTVQYRREVSPVALRTVGEPGFALS